MTEHTEILIVGGGVIGLTTAWYLAKEGARVTVVESGPIGRQSSWAGAGILPPAEWNHARSAVERLRARSFQLYPELSAELCDLTGIDNGFSVCGGIELPDPDQPEALLPTEEWHGEGVDFERLDAADLHRLSPELNRTFHEGVFLPGMAQVRNPRHLNALQSACRMRGVRILEYCPVRRFIVQRQRIVELETDDRRIAANQTLIAAGAWSGQLLETLGTRLPVRPVRGQMVLFNLPNVGTQPILLQGKRYLVPRGDGCILVGSTEEEVGFDSVTTEEGIAGLIGFARSLLPALRTKIPEKTWAGLRPGSPDGIPFLGPLPGWDNLHVAAGHFRAGLMLSPATGLILSQSLLGKPLLVPLDEFRLDRFDEKRPVEIASTELE